jgi:replicative DNA helicase
MLSADAIRAAADNGVTETTFYQPKHRQIFAAITALHARQTPRDPVTVAEQLRQSGQLDGVGGLKELLRIQAATPASANAPYYAEIIAACAYQRNLIVASADLAEIGYTGGDIAEIVARLTAPTTAAVRARAVLGGEFTLDVPDQLPAVWGEADRVLWAEGEELLVVGPPGVGKTTIAAQLVAARIGLIDNLLGLPVASATRVLYLACDRPSQIQRAFNRLFGTAERDTLDERLTVWKGPPPQDFGRHPETLTNMAHTYHADCVFIDSLKDVALGLSDDEVGAGLNSSIQHALAEGINVCALHHQRKGQGGSKPMTLEDVYGSTWITAGAGSVVLLWGKAGDLLIELKHLKQPAMEVGPITIDHDHHTGQTTIDRGELDPTRVLRNAQNGITATDYAILAYGTEKPADKDRRRAKHVLDGLVRKGIAHAIEGQTGGPDGATPTRYYATTPDPPTTQNSQPDTEEPF